MTGCAQPIDWETLAAYWLGELTEQAEAPLEEHLFACAHCTQRLEKLAALAAGVRAAVRNGMLQAVVTPSFLELMKREDMRVREYALGPGEKVDCTLRAEDDAVAGRVRVPLAGVKRLDALQSLEVGGEVQHWRVEDLPFEPDKDEMVVLPSAAALRKLPANTARLRLVAVDDSGERLLGEYTFAHMPG